VIGEPRSDTGSTARVDNQGKDKSEGIKAVFLGGSVFFSLYHFCHRTFLSTLVNETTNMSSTANPSRAGELTLKAVAKTSYADDKASKPDDRTATTSAYPGTALSGLSNDSAASGTPNSVLVKKIWPFEK
jgi:hypothetical protein